MSHVQFTSLLLFAKLSFKCHECVFSCFHFFPGVVYNAEQIGGIERTVRRVPKTRILVRGGYKLENMPPKNIETSFLHVLWVLVQFLFVGDF